MLLYYLNQNYQAVLGHHHATLDIMEHNHYFYSLVHIDILYNNIMFFYKILQYISENFKITYLMNKGCCQDLNWNYLSLLYIKKLIPYLHTFYALHLTMIFSCYSNINYYVYTRMIFEHTSIHLYIQKVNLLRIVLDSVLTN